MAGMYARFVIAADLLQVMRKARSDTKAMKKSLPPLGQPSAVVKRLAGMML
jgi:hypothetical protein